MKKSLISTLSVLLFLFLSCSEDDSESNGLTTEQSKIVGTWQRNTTYGSIEGTERITFKNDKTYSVELTRTEQFDGPCSLDPYCDNNYSGDFWFENDNLYYDHSSLGWTDYYENWSVEGTLLNLDGDIYQKL